MIIPPPPPLGLCLQPAAPVGLCLQRDDLLRVSNPGVQHRRLSPQAWVRGGGQIVLRARERRGTADTIEDGAGGCAGVRVGGCPSRSLIFSFHGCAFICLFVSSPQPPPPPPPTTNSSISSINPSTTTTTTEGNLPVALRSPAACLRRSKRSRHFGRGGLGERSSKPPPPPLACLALIFSHFYATSLVFCSLLSGVGVDSF